MLDKYGKYQHSYWMIFVSIWMFDLLIMHAYLTVTNNLVYDYVIWCVRVAGSSGRRFNGSYYD